MHAHAHRYRRQRAVTALAAAANSHSGRGNDEEPLYLPATASTYVPFSAQLMLAMARQGHLERFREELAAAYEPGAPVELTRCALLISGIAQPQLDHRPYYDALEQMLAAASLLLMRKLGGQGDSESFGGLDLHDPEHVLRAAQAICEVLFEQEGLHINVDDPHAPENGSLADVMSTGRGGSGCGGCSSAGCRACSCTLLQLHARQGGQHLTAHPLGHACA
jgi:hypothetical protein